MAKQNGKRYLLITADDFGIGPATSDGILQLAQRGLVGSSVLMANSPHAEYAIKIWNAAGRSMELGWHPALTNDAPVLPAGEVSSLVDSEGRFFSLNGFLRRLYLHQIDQVQVRAELSAQYQRCSELLGMRPRIVNTHHHIQIFKPIRGILQDILMREGGEGGWGGAVRPYLRLIREPWPMLWKVPGARVKRMFVNWHGRRSARRQRQRGFLGNDWLIGVSDPKSVNDSNFFTNLIRSVPGRVVELTCHPGFFDSTLVGRDCTPTDGMQQRRVREFELLSEPAFLDVCAQAGFELISPSQLAVGVRRSAE